ncbi:hypothetical protein V6Z12_A04G172300 [Gossypium hirsutum]
MGSFSPPFSCLSETCSQRPKDKGSVPLLLDHAERRRKLRRRGHGADLALRVNEAEVCHSGANGVRGEEHRALDVSTGHVRRATLGRN